MNNFSVIMPVYFKERPERLRLAINSLLEQTITPGEIVIVLDGPVGKELNNVIQKFNKIDFIRIIELAENKGVGIARKTAIEKAKYDILALMDSDDISCKDRFEKQIEKIINGDAQVVGGWIEEFKEKPGDIGSVRKLPKTHEEIYKFGKWRMPVNNVTLMFTREVYDAAGGYSEQTKNEDWNLVVNLIATGARFFNIPETVVHARAGEDMIIRRRGWTHQITALHIFPLMYKLRYIGIFHLVSNIAIRVVLRMLPIGTTSYLYRKVLRTKS